MSLISAVLVVAIHCAGSADVGLSGWWFNQLVSWGVANMAVPFFFFASGYFAAKSFGQEGYWGQGLCRRVKTLLVPYFVWSILFFAWLLILRGVQSGLHGETAGLAQLINWRVVPEILGLNPFEMPLLFPCWYVRALMVLFLLLPFFRWMSGAGKRFAFSLAIGVALLVLTRNLDGNWNSFFRLTLSIEDACYFLIGCYARRRDFCQVQTRGAACVAAAIVMAVLVLRTFARAQGMQTSPWLDYALTPLMIFALMGIVSDRAWPSALTGSSFGVFLIHPFVLAVLGVIVV